MPNITVTDDDGVAVVRITRPPANVIDPALGVPYPVAAIEIARAEVPRRLPRLPALDRITAGIATDPVAEGWLDDETTDAAAATLRGER